MLAIRPSRLSRRHRRGAMMVFAGLMMMIIVVFAAIVINLSYIELARTELRIATDAAARATGRELVRTGDTNLAMLKGREVGSRNLVVGNPLNFDDSDFVFGTATRDAEDQRYVFIPGTASVNSVQVSGRFAEDSANGSVRLCVPNVLGMGTFETAQDAVTTQSELDIVLVLDRSGSMAFSVDENGGSSSIPASASPGWTFGDPAPPASRWRDVVAATQVFLNALDSTASVERVALCTYNGNPWADSTLDDSDSAITTALDGYTSSFEGGATNIGGGIQCGLDTLNAFEGRDWATKLMIVMTDGMHNTGSSPLVVTETAVADKVIIYTISFANDADVALMASIANRTGGKHFHAPTTQALNEAFEEISQSLPSLLAK
ncbi:MAG: VWA domain-containing protein [Planctomycetota bacterium]